tara:strand:+ start:1964 stop:2518 length:555 start_codon:yes stop_codon:yes gene_type:complete
MVLADCKNDNFTPKNYDIWYVERDSINGKWSSPINVGKNINSLSDEFYPSVSSSGNLYFTSLRKGGYGEDDIIYMSERKKNVYQLALPLSDKINTLTYEFNSFISPDESFVIFCGYNRKDGQGSGDMYISIKDNNLNCSEVQNLGQCDSKYMDYSPFVDLNTNTIYFTSRRSNEDAINQISNKL